MFDPRVREEHADIADPVGPARVARGLSLPRGEPGSIQAFESFHEKGFRVVVRAVRPVVGDACEDVAQEAFLVAFERWGELSQLRDPLAWVRKVATRMAWRRASREHRRPDLEMSGQLLLGSSNPEAHDLDLRASLRHLPRKQAAAVALHYLLDWSIADVATALDATEPTVKTWLHRARPMLAERLAGLAGRWVVVQPIGRDEMVERVERAGAGRGLEHVMNLMPAGQARWVLTIAGGRFLLENDDGEYFDHGRYRLVDGAIHLRSTIAAEGEAVHRISRDAERLHLAFVSSTMHPTDGVDDGVFQRSLLDGVEFGWVGP